MAIRESLSPAELKPALIELYDPIRQGLYAYQEMSDGAINFDIERAAMLGYEPGKPNSARSVSPVGSRGERISDLYVVAFQPEDGTGDESTTRLVSNSVAAGLPFEAKVLPRSKETVAAELMMPLVSAQLDQQDIEPELYDVTLDLLGFEQGRNNVKKIGELGVDRVRRTPDVEIEPVAYHTVEPRIINTGSLTYVPTIERFGDPHAIFSSRESALQVVAFLAITDDVARQNPDIFLGINQSMPRRAPFLPLN